MQKRVVAAILVGSLGGLVFGCDLGALSAATQSLKVQFTLSPWAFGWTISASIWGTVLGSVLAGRFADRHDRRSLIILSALLYTLGALCIATPFGSIWTLFLGMRFSCGVAIGGFTVGCPLYLSELASIPWRGRVVSLFQIQVGAGVILAFSASAVLLRMVHFGTAWKWILGVGGIPALALFLLGQLMLTKDKYPAGHLELSALERENEDSAGTRLLVRKNARLILLATSIAVFNQLSGVNILLLYMLQILASAGVTFQVGHRYSILISGLSLASTFVGMVFVDSLGRKSLLYIGSLGMAFCLLDLGLAVPHRLHAASYLYLYVAYNAFFAFSQGTVVWVYLSELFPPGLRGVGQGYGSTVHWVMNAVLIAVFPSVQHHSSVGVFYIFASMMVLQVAVIWRWYPETSGTALGSVAAANGARLD